MTNTALYAPSWVDKSLLPNELVTMIAPGLYPGRHRRRRLDRHGDRAASRDDASGFDAVVTLFAWALPCSWGVEELRYGFPDAHPDLADMTRVVAAARWAHERWVSGDRVLIRCQAGLDRSGLRARSWSSCSPAARRRRDPPRPRRCSASPFNPDSLSC